VTFSRAPGAGVLRAEQPIELLIAQLVAQLFHLDRHADHAVVRDRRAGEEVLDRLRCAVARLERERHVVATLVGLVPALGRGVAVDEAVLPLVGGAGRLARGLVTSTPYCRSPI
jgi:hypothetical protein